MTPIFLAFSSGVRAGSANASSCCWATKFLLKRIELKDASASLASFAMFFVSSSFLTCSALIDSRMASSLVLA